MSELVLVWDSNFVEIENQLPTFADVVERISLLDGVGSTLVTLYRGQAHFACGGSAKTGLVVYATFDSAVFWQLVSSRESTAGETTVVAGGQTGAYSANHVVDLVAATSAATAFFKAGILATDQAWEKQ
ncbi:Imm1 family immunity protein [Actinophytocola xinjiangensis]|nr:Imm1 family immunity protein [Actinophytocola xinjiangensis]